MQENKISEVYRLWAQAFDNMGAVLTMNPLLTVPLRASAQMFQQFGQAMFGNGNAAPKFREDRKRGRHRSTAAASHTQSRVKAGPRRRKPTAHKR